MVYDPSIGKAVPKKEPLKFPVKTGRDIYYSRSMTGQNRSPLQDLLGFIMSGLDAPDDVMPEVETTALILMRDGSFAMTNPTIPDDREFMEDVYCPSKKKIMRYKRDPDSGKLDFRIDGDDMTRVRANSWQEYTLTDGGWLHEDVSIEDGKEIRKTITTLPADNLWAYPNDRGILYYAQDILHLLEDNRKTTLRTLRGVNLLPMILGETNVTSQAFEEAENAVVIPGQVTVARPVSTDSMNALATESAQARADWMDALNVTEKDAPQRPSGRDREIRMQSMIQFVRKTRSRLEKIYQTLNVAIKFDELIVRGADERLKELDLLIAVNDWMQRSGAEIDAAQFIRRLKSLA